MIIRRDCTVLLDFISDVTITITVQAGVRVLILDAEGFQERDITIIAARDAQIRFEALHAHGDSNVKVTTIAQGSHADIQLRIGSITKKADAHRIETQQIHEASKTQSHCEVRSICYDESRSAYEGMILISKKSEKTEAHQQHKALLIDEAARAYARPSLEVQVDDVLCGHGSAVGQLDDEQLFYLQARGMSQGQAKKLLTKAFLADLFHNSLLLQQLDAHLLNASL